MAQTRALLGLVRELRKSGEVTSSALARLRPALNKAENMVRQGDATGRLLALQDVRLTLYGLPPSEVTAQARNAIDDRLTSRLGAPQALLFLALKMRLATNAGHIDPAMSGRLASEVKAAIAAPLVGLAPVASERLSSLRWQRAVHHLDPGATKMSSSTPTERTRSRPDLIAWLENSAPRPTDATAAARSRGTPALSCSQAVNSV
ncbi:hypothetical protein ACQP1W_28105 [Spirillospora sp. CA-255316]